MKMQTGTDQQALVHEVKDQVKCAFVVQHQSAALPCCHSAAGWISQCSLVLQQYGQRFYSAFGSSNKHTWHLQLQP